MAQAASSCNAFAIATFSSYSIFVYFLVQFYVDAEYTDLKLPVDILIGTVPLRESVRSLPAAQFAPIVSSQPPSAPPLDQPYINNYNLRMFHSPDSFVVFESELELEFRLKAFGVGLVLY